MLYDVFICHATEDKGRFVRPLAAALKNENIEVWYDEFSLAVGDSIRRAIDIGLTKSRFGIVVLSKAFFKKNWPQYELDGLAQREMAGNDTIILPVWYNISHSEIVAISPSLAGRVALRSSQGKKHIVSEIKKRIHPTGSPLIEARDMLLEWGVTPPVITDQFWLNIIEASNRSPAYGAMIPDDSIWDRWSFPLPSKETEWGSRLAWTAMQLKWVEEADNIPITPLTEPKVLHDFILANPGLFETCIDYPGLAIEYAPQLSINGFEGPILDSIEKAYSDNIERREKLRKTSPTSGTGLTVNSEFPPCDEEWALRHENFGFYDDSTISSAYFHGGMFGPRVSPFQEPEHLFWLLSEKSSWLPNKIHSVLLSGIAKTHSLPWWKHDRTYEEVDEWPSSGSFAHALHNAAEGKKVFTYTPKVLDDIKQRIALAKVTLSLPESIEDLLGRFKKANITELWLKENRKRREKRSKNK